MEDAKYTNIDKKVLSPTVDIVDNSAGVVGGTHYFTYASKKAEKLATAVYMITDFLSDTEPMKEKIRALGLAVLSDIQSMDHLLLSERKNMACRALGDIENIVSFLEISASTELISFMNVDVLKNEFASLGETLRRQIFSLNEKAVFSSDFFALQEPKHNPFPHKEGGENSEFNIAPASLSGEVDSRLAIVNTNLTIHQKIRQKKKDEMSSRRELILRFVREKKEVTIGDVAAHLPAVGEKTIQRELIALQQSGLIDRRGDRRWSRYLIR